MERKVGTVSRGLRAPIIKEGEDLSQIVIDTVLDAANSGEFTIQDRDVLAVTESILARSQANYATKEQIAAARSDFIELAEQFNRVLDRPCRSIRAKVSARAMLHIP